MSEGLGIGRFHHLAQSRTCPECGCALGSRDHEEACEPQSFGPMVADFAVGLRPEVNPLGLEPEVVRAIGRAILDRAEKANLVLQVLKSRK